MTTTDGNFIDRSAGHRIVIWSVTGIVACMFAVVSLFLFAVELSRLNTVAGANCRRDNATRMAVRDLVHSQVIVRPDSTPEQVNEIHQFLAATDTKLANHPC